MNPCNLSCIEHLATGLFNEMYFQVEVVAMVFHLFF